MIELSKYAYLGPVVCALAASPALAEDWPQWRGPNRNGVATRMAAEKPWPEKLKSVWKVTVGEGHSSPVVAGDRVYQFARRGDREVLASFDLTSGRKIWETGYPAPYQMNFAAVSHGKGPKATPLIANGKIYTLGIAGVLTSFDAATGKTVWSHDFRRDYKSGAPLYGSAASPLLDRSTLIVHVGADEHGGLTALDANSGKVKWIWKGDGPSYASALVADIAGTRQVITQSNQNVIGVAADSGTLLWKVPFTTPYAQNSVTPVLDRDLVIVSGVHNPTFAIRVKKQGNGYTTEKVWENREISMYMSTPVMINGTLFGLSNRNRGQFFSLNPLTGKTIWTGEGRQADNAALIARSNTVFALTTSSELLLMNASPRGLEFVRKYQVASSPTWAHPVIAGNRIVVKDVDSLALWSGE